MHDENTQPITSYARDRDWLLVHCRGNGDAAWLTGLFFRIAERLATEAASAVLIDGREVVATFSVYERYRLGEAAAAALVPGPPVALVGSEQTVDPERFGETVARNRGLDGRVFTDLGEARDWLKERVAARAG